MFELLAKNGLKALLSEAIPAISASTQIFANAPAGTQYIEITVRSQSITMRFDGSAATAGANGHDYAAGGTYGLQLNKTNALLVRAIQGAATATGWITYFALVGGQ